MCHCKKNSRLEPLLRYLEGFFECVGSPLSGSRASLKDIYGDLLTSLYQLDDNGNKVVVDCSEDGNNFVIDVNKPVYVGSLRDNSDSNCGSEISNAYNDIVSLGFKPTNPEYPGVNHLLSSFIIDAEEDSLLPISYDEAGDYYVFSNNVKALCLPKVNFNFYQKSIGENNKYNPIYGFGIKREGSEEMGYLRFSDSVVYFTGAVDEFGNSIARAELSVLMLPTDNYGNSFELFDYTDDAPYGEFGSKLEVYTFDNSVGYGEEVDAKGSHELFDIRLLNADSKYEDLVPEESWQFIGTIYDKQYHDDEEDYVLVHFGNVFSIPAGRNDKIYCRLEPTLYVVPTKKKYIRDITNNYISAALSLGIYNTRTFYDTPAYLYNVESEIDYDSIEDNAIDLPVKRLPVVNLTGRLSKSKFDSYKPYIYIFKTKGNSMPNHGVFLCEYKDLDSDLIFQVADNYRWLSEETEFIIFCSDIEVDYETSLISLVGMNVSPSYSLICQPTEMNEDVVYDITPLI